MLAKMHLRFLEHQLELLRQPLVHGCGQVARDRLAAAHIVGKHGRDAFFEQGVAKFRIGLDPRPHRRLEREGQLTCAMPAHHAGAAQSFGGGVHRCKD
ncbi:MAG: hypothetical protein JSR59_20085 [Proteobacteria bacterium]|nr:hypothetical protein [Pseudomonadota bacterium]